MPKFSGSTPLPARPHAVATTTATTLTHEGGLAYTRTPRSELFLLAVTDFAEDTFYESAPERRQRLAHLVAQVAQEADGPAWLNSFLPWLRRKAHLRSVPVVLLAEMAHARCLPRSLVPATLDRPDEPAELLGYWLTHHGRQIPTALKRGLADAATALYDERAALRYDGQSRAIRMADVIELTHPTPRAEWQSALFRHLIDRRHHRPDPAPPILQILNADQRLTRTAPDERAALLAHALDNGWSWERIGGWLPGGFTAEVWEALIPKMGYMALLRNLRNFDEAGISFQTKEAVVSRLADPTAVFYSRQLPYRFLSAWKAAPAMHWGPALEAALDHSLQSIPRLRGRTAIFIDTSGSMQSPVGGQRSQAMRWEAAALFGAALARTAERADVFIYATESQGADLHPTASILRHVEAMGRLIGSVGHGTNTWAAIARWYGGHDRVIVLTDEQSHDDGTSLWERHGTGLGARPWMHWINLAGYRAATAAPHPRSFSYGGFTDAMFTLIPQLEAGASGRWPWESQG